MTAPAVAVIDPGSDAACVAALIEIQRANDTPHYSVQCFEVDLAGTVIQDLTYYLNKNDSDEIRYDSTADIQEDLTITFGQEVSLRWGSAKLAVYQLIKSAAYNTTHGYVPGTWLRFALGHYVVTTPGFDDMDAADVRAVHGYGKNYLLQTMPRNSFAFDYATTYKAAIQTIFIAAGLVTTNLSEVALFPGSWPQTLPSPRNYPVSGNMTYLDIVNELLKASGCRPLSVRRDGMWWIEFIPKPIKQDLRWTWAASAGTTADVNVKAVLRHKSRFTGDVYAVPNQWVFTQAGLGFEPTGSDGSNGLYIVNNTTIAPSDQTSVGRIITVTQDLQASGQTELVSQGDEIVADALRGTEQISLDTAPWPSAGHYDVFTVAHTSFPDNPIRRVQAQSWALPLWGQPMTWQCFAVLS